MPSELRHLLFRPSEVAEAVQGYYRRTGKPLPNGKVIHCAPEVEANGGVVCFRMTIALGPVDPKQTPGADNDICQNVVIDGPALIGALILSCRDRGIPLPATAEKSLQLFGAQLCLLVTINQDKAKCRALTT